MPETFTIPVKCKIEQNKKRRLIIHLYLDDYDMDKLVLEGGKTPKSIFKEIIVHGV